MKALDGDIVAVELDDKSKWKLVESRFNKQKDIAKPVPALPTVCACVCACVCPCVLCVMCVVRVCVCCVLCVRVCVCVVCCGITL